MKKGSTILSAILCALLITCLAASACAETVPSSALCKPVISETFKTLVGGKTFEAGVTRKECFGEDEDAFYTVTITAAEETRYAANDIESLKEGDIITFKPGTSIMIGEKTADETGFEIKDAATSDKYLFIKMEDGTYVARTETDNMFYTELFTVTIPLSKDISFLDWSDPENLEAPVKKGYAELLDLLLEDTNFSPYNTKVTFDENGKLSEFLYTYSPWN